MAGAMNLIRKVQNLRAIVDADPYARDLGAYQAGAAKLIPQMYAPAYRAISDQARPEFNSARNYLAANPAAANSGVANGLNNRILSGAYGALAGSMGRTSAGAAQGGLDLLGNLIQRRVAARYEAEAEKRKKKGGFGRALGSVVGAGLGAIGGPVLGAVGSKIGGNILGGGGSDYGTWT